MKCAYGINFEEQCEALNAMEALVKSMKFGNTSENRQRKEMMPFQKGILTGMYAVKFLYDTLKNEKFKYLMTTKVFFQL